MKKKVITPDMSVDPILIMFGQMALAKAIKEKKSEKAPKIGA